MGADRIREGDIVRVTDPQGIEHEAIADGGPENGHIWVRFTIRGHATPVPARRVKKVENPW